MDIRKVKKLIELLDESGIAEIEITEGEEAVRISRYPQGAAAAPVAPAPVAVCSSATGTGSDTRGRSAIGSGAVRGSRACADRRRRLSRHGANGWHVLYRLFAGCAALRSGW